MKRNLVEAALVAFVMACGCNEKEVPAPSGKMSGEMVTLNVSVPSAGMTRITDVGDEDRINGIQVFVFRENGALDAWSSSGGNSLSLQCTSGEREVVAIANAPEIPAVSSRSALEEQISSLGDNSPGGLVMSGSRNVSLTASSSLSVTVSRLAARVSIERIVSDFGLDQYRNAELKITGIYLVNAAGEASYCGEPAQPALWYNKGRNEGDIQELLGSGTLDQTLTSETPYETVHSFYCYPNPVAGDSSEPEWTPRRTRLVVEAQLDGVTYYYPMTMPQIESNHLYTVSELKITRPGSSSPDVPVVSGMASFTVEVADWDEGYTGSFEI